ncbi:DUF1572 family protein [Winogradskyella sp. SYSU M77433]|uniref:DUF1572 family protein n=1 Tax=Winogradskyella sp. SYSU M77433 TaxID=3042722 RepID=UPI0024817948|nr:DUF1572 family protein [Winogradskyella sp. SYSU M77433]MDH7912710.1 DUF1572 family protein [Winogradskyella sp. SYSU M77433]
MKSYLSSSIKQFEYYKSLGDKTFEQLSFNELQREFEEDSNSITIIVKHMVGNMLSRWTNFLTEDGEKEWRKRDEEFIDSFKNKAQFLEDWEKGWNCLFNAIKPLQKDDLERVIYIRNQGHSITEAINRQMMHYAYHVGQIVLLGKLTKGSDWVSLSIPKGKSKAYNKDKFSKEKSRKHFTDDV